MNYYEFCNFVQISFHHCTILVCFEDLDGEG